MISSERGFDEERLATYDAEVDLHSDAKREFVGTSVAVSSNVSYVGDLNDDAKVDMNDALSDLSTTTR